MIVSPEPGPPICMVVPMANHARFFDFEQSLDSLWLPGGSTFGRVRGSAITHNCNVGMRPRAEWKDYEFFFFLDDDHKFAPQIAVRLARHNLPIVGALTCVARPPFAPTIYKGEETVDGERRLIPYEWADLDDLSGPLVVYAMGRAGMLVRRDVMEALWDAGPPIWRSGQVNLDQVNEDWDFCLRARALGFEPVVDLDTPMGHLAAVAAWPTRDAQSRWTIGLDWAEGKTMTLRASR